MMRWENKTVKPANLKKNHCAITKQNVILYNIDIQAGGYCNIWTQVK